MNNQRASFRQPFGPSHPLCVRLTAPNNAIFELKVVDLSLDGVRVQAESGLKSQYGKWLAQFYDPISKFDLIITIESIFDIKYRDSGFSFCFVFPSNSIRKGILEKLIWKYLLEEQRLHKELRKNNTTVPLRVGRASATRCRFLAYDSF